MAHSHGHDEDKVPERTTPQGSQELGVESGHEGTDVRLRPVTRWFIGLAISLAFFEVALLGAYIVWREREQRKITVPSPLFLTRQVPPQPRLWPNRFDWPGGAGEDRLRGGRRTIVPDPPGIQRAERARELQAAADLGLADPRTGLSQLPDLAVSAVLANQGRTAVPGAPRPVPGREGTSSPPGTALTGPLDRLMPSSSSGGTMPENWTVPDPAFREQRQAPSGG
jgi:hypothetical protein